jgi:catechol 2,3-dioxygenase-like lactoylglutathione lyase family enzyme
MLGEADVTATIAVKDIEAAKKFYGGTLGLTQMDENSGGVTYKSGTCKLYVYPSQFAGTNKATYVAWKIDDVEAAVEELKGKGIVFEEYDNLPDTTREGAIHTMGPMKGAWFKDPDGNILSFGNM